MKSIGIFSHDISPTRNGHTLVIDRLFDDYIDNSIVFTDSGNGNSVFKNIISVGKKENKKLKYCLMKYDFIYKLYIKYVKKFKYGKAIMEFETQLKCNKVDKLVVFSGSLFYPEICRMIAEKYSIPFYFYILDDYVEQCLNKVDKENAKRIMNNVVKSYAFCGFIVTNESIKDIYSIKYGSEVLTNFSDMVHIVRNPMSDAAFEKMNYSEIPGDSNIVYTGSVYDAHFDAFDDLIGAMDYYNAVNKTEKIYLDIYTNQTYAHLKRNIHRIEQPYIRVHGIVNDENELSKIQKSATMLFLPLGLKTKYPEIVVTSAPGKLGEYLVSKRPIIARVPYNSYIAKYLKEYMDIVDIDSSSIFNDYKMYKEIVKIINGEYDNEKIENAYNYGMAEFTIEKNKKRFNNLIEFEEEIGWC